MEKFCELTETVRLDDRTYDVRVFVNVSDVECLTDLPTCPGCGIVMKSGRTLKVKESYTDVKKLLQQCLGL